MPAGPASARHPYACFQRYTADHWMQMQAAYELAQARRQRRKGRARARTRRGTDFWCAVTRRRSRLA